MCAESNVTPGMATRDPRGFVARDYVENFDPKVRDLILHTSTTR